MVRVHFICHWACGGWLGDAASSKDVRLAFGGTERAAPYMKRCACGTERAARIVWRVGSDWRFLSLPPSLPH